MTFEEILQQTVAILQSRGRVSYRALQRQFELDDAYLADLKNELLYAYPQVVEDEGRGLVWTRETAEASPPVAGAPLADHASVRAPHAYTPPYLAEKILTSRSALEGERKHVTVLFADIKDSTELIKDLDPEDAQKLLDPAIHIMMDAVHRFEGTVNQVLGDGIMALFGAPISHEDHAARACYAALGMQSAMQDYTEEARRKQGLELRIRVGLNSGEVVVRTIGNDLHMDYSAVGPTTNLAARMEQTAMPGSIRLAATTLRLVEGLVRVNVLGAVPVKGMTEPVEVYELTGASAIRRRLQAAVTRGLTKFIGRDMELEALNQARERAGAGHGQVIAAVGEAGVGKSRLVYEFVHSHRTQGWLMLESASVSYGRATPYFPLLDLLRRYCHIEERDEPRTVRAKVTGQVLTLDEALQDTIPALLSLLEVLPDDSTFRSLDPPQRRQRTLQALKRVLLRESQVQPLLLVFEDLHWIDTETQALLDRLIESLSTAQLLLLVNYRPEYQHGWGGKTFYTQLRLDPLPPESADAFLEALLGNDPSLEPLKKLLIERTERNPFFLEESVHTLVETQVIRGEQGAYRLARELATIQVPSTVQAILAARIDRLPQDEKRLVQTAAVIGTEVPLPLLQAIVEMPEAALHRGLTHLQAAEFLYETSLFPERVYTFKHALTHEVAYGGLLHERRRALHAHIAEAIERLALQRVAEQAERLAHHAVRGELWEKAVTSLRQAGLRAMARAAYREAVAHLEQALGALRRLPESLETTELTLDLQLDLQNALLPLGEWARMGDLLHEAEGLARRLGDQRRLARIATFMVIQCLVTGEYDEAVSFGQEALTIAQTLGDRAIEVVATSFLGMTHCARGELSDAVRFLARNVALEGDLRYERFGAPAIQWVLSGAYLADVLSQLGQFDEAIRHAEAAVRIAETADHLFSLYWGLLALGRAYLRRGDLPRATGSLERCLDVCPTGQITDGILVVSATLGVVYALNGRADEALPLAAGAVEEFRSRGLHREPGLILLCAGMTCLAAGQLDEAASHAREALALSRRLRARSSEAHALCFAGDVASRGGVEDAPGYYREALVLAGELGMRPLQAHCHHGLGTLCSQTGQLDQAHAELSAAIDMYRDMEMTFWLSETEAKLERLKS